MRTTSPPVDSVRDLSSAGERTAVLSGLTTLAVLSVAFGAMALGVPYFWVVFPVGFGGILPLVVAYSRRTERAVGGSQAAHTGDEPMTLEDSHRDDALQALRARYARGELTDETFERRLEHLLETGTVAEAENWTQHRADDAHDHRDGDEGERGRE